jgi:SAM-dependent methyltransferase
MERVSWQLAILWFHGSPVCAAGASSRWTLACWNWDRRTFLSGEVAERTLAELFPNNTTSVSNTAQAAFYRIFGVSSYRSLDIFDARANYRFDLNYWIPAIRRFDVITNFGTWEHVFRIDQAFRTVHKLLKPGGVLLCVMPAFGDIDHGFYNIHPVFYRKFCEANAYEIADFQFIDNFANKNWYYQDQVKEEFDFDSLPIKLADMGDYRVLRKKVYENYIKNSSSIETRLYQEKHDNTIEDYCFVAIKKVRDAPFVVPTQYGDRIPGKWENLRWTLRFVAKYARVRWRRLWQRS